MPAVGGDYKVQQQRADISSEGESTQFVNCSTDVYSLMAHFKSAI